MQNIALSVVLPKGLKLKNGQMLYDDTTFTFVSEITPYYASVDIVRLVGGAYTNKIPDLTIASMVFNVSQQADSHSYLMPATPQTTDPTDPQVRKMNLFLDARQNWVSNVSAASLVQNVWDILGARGSKTLGNFSNERLAGVSSDGVPQLVQSLRKEADKWRIVMNSGADVGFGGHVKGGWGAKALYDVDAPAGRTWAVTGMGANAKSVAGYGSSGKPVKYASGPMLAWRMGRYYGSYTMPYFAAGMSYPYVRV